MVKKSDKKHADAVRKTQASGVAIAKVTSNGARVLIDTWLERGWEECAAALALQRSVIHSAWLVDTHAPHLLVEVGEHCV